MLQNNLSLLLFNNKRSLEYLKCFKKHDKKLKRIIFVDNKKHSLNRNQIIKIINSKKTCSNNKILYGKSLNNKIVKYVMSQSEKNFIVSLNHGEIVKNSKLLIKKNLIHFHPGRLPYFRGATSIYYSLLKEKQIYCSCIILSNKIDGGGILFEKKFGFPKSKRSIDYDYDIEIRCKSLVYFIKNNKTFKISNQKKILKHHYYLAHPIIRNLAFFKMFKNNKT